MSHLLFVIIIKIILFMFINCMLIFYYAKTVSIFDFDRKEITVEFLDVVQELNFNPNNFFNFQLVLNPFLKHKNS